MQLNVGGTVFTTSWSTLIAQDTFFSGVYRQREAADALEEPGPIFVDRDPTLFKSVLQYLRTGHMEVPPSIAAVTVSKGTNKVLGFWQRPTLRGAERAERRWAVLRCVPVFCVPRDLTRTCPRLWWCVWWAHRSCWARRSTFQLRGW